MNELLASLEADVDDAEGWISIVDADWFADDLKLTLSVKFHDDRAELWEVACNGVVEESLCSDGASTLAVSAHSPLLKPFAEPEVAMMFAENAMAPEALLGIVCSCCIEVMGRPESIARYLNATPTLNGIVSSQFGLLGRFPESLAARILDALRDKPIKAHALDGYLPKRWNGSEHVAYKDLLALELDRSYVLAHGFSACRS
jgi:hypothetical protein